MEEQKDFPFWIACLTQSGSEGIYSAYFNQETGQTNQLKLEGKSSDVSYLVKHPSEPILFSNKEGQLYDKEGAVDLWRIENNNILTHIQQLSSKGEEPCFLCLSPDNKNLYVANYNNGTVTKYSYSNGQLTEQRVVQSIYPKKKQHERQEMQHAHSIYPFKNKYLISADLGSDLLVIYDFDLNILDTCQMNEGCGPRHFAFIENIILVVGELDQTLNIVVFSEQTTKFKLVNSFKTLLETDYYAQEKKNEILCSHILVSDDKKFIYIPNRTHDTITTFERTDDTYQNWKYKYNVSCGGSHPRHFEFSPNQSYILCSNQLSHSVSILKRDSETGELTLTGNNLQIKNPMFVLFK